MKDSQLFDNLRQLISVVDELRDVGVQQYISLPRIVVVGTQSSGKSSVLESVVGLDFLPRGDGVVTRRPLELRLQHLSEVDHGADEAYAIFPQVDSTKKFNDFMQVRQEIDRLTDLVAGKNKGIVDDPIVLNVFGTQCPDLTVIDLPGITRVAVAGTDQGEDIEAVTRDMAMRYIKDPRTIILAVLGANADMSTSDALQLARKADPNGLRTIGVLTKIDIMDQGTDAVRMLQGQDIPLRLGYVGVKNRSQKNIRDGMKVKEALVEEKEWFESHRSYSKLPPGMVGTSSLTSKLTKVFYRHLRNFLPEIKREINDRKRQQSERLEQLGQGVPIDVAERVQLMWTMITDYCDMYKNTIRGKYDRKLQLYLEAGGDSGVSGGSQIRQIFNDFLLDYEGENITAAMSDEDIERAIRTHEGDSLPGFPSSDTFEFLILPHLRKVNSPTMELLNTVSNALDMLAQRIARTVFRRFPKLADEVLNRTQDILTRERDASRVVLENIVSYETGYLFTNDSLYLTEHGSMEPIYRDAKKQAEKESAQATAVNGGPAPPQDQTTAGQFGEKISAAGSYMKDTASSLHAKYMQGGQNPMTKKQARYSGPFVSEIRRRLDAYFSLIIRNVRDAIPKAVGFFLVRQLQEKLQFELFTQLNKAEMFSNLLGEPEHIVEERRALSAQLKTLDKALHVLNRDPAIVALQMEAFDEEQEQPKPPAPKPAPPRADFAAPSAGRPNPPAPAPVPSHRATAPQPSKYMPPAPSLPNAGPKKPQTPASLFDDAPKKSNPHPLFD